MTDIRCAFEGHRCRATICKGRAASFFRTAQGTVWPLCEACAERHKSVGMAMVQGGRLEVDKIVRAQFDIPIDDEAARHSFAVQDPERIRQVIDIVDMMYMKG